MFRSALLLLLLTACLATAEPSTGIPGPKVFLIRGAKIIPGDGTTLPETDLLIRDGVIADIGKNLPPPPDAVVIEARNQVVFPAFVDAGTPRGYDPAMRRSEGGPAEAETLESDILIATKPDHRRGMTPEFLVRNALKPDDQTAWRKLGFATQVIIPEGGLFSGQSVILSLNGSTPRNAILKPEAAQHAMLRNIPGGEYPRALMGVFAHCRQTLLDAGHLQRQITEFGKKGGTGKRPPFDPCLEALAKCLDRKMPVWFEADTMDEIHRTLDFAEEFKLRAVVFGGHEARKVADRLLTAKVPVVLKLNFTEPAEREGELPIRTRMDLARNRFDEVHNATVLHEKGVPFVFSTAGLPGDNPSAKFAENLKKVREAGLPATAALKALTSGVAAIPGIDLPLGLLAKGRAANVVLADGDPLEPATQVLSLFADGVRFETEPKPTLRKDIKPLVTKAKPLAYDDMLRLISRIPPEALPKTSELDSDRKPLLQTGGNLLITGATILPVTGEPIPDGFIHIESGKIAAFGPMSKVPEMDRRIQILPAKGMFVLPGIIDTHAHFAISGGVNEFSLSAVPEVRVRDVIDSQDIEIYRALAGGVTTARLLHGSANVIGGQDAVIRLKYGRSAKEMLLEERTRGVKFALGENVKRTDGRFPNTRMGVEAVLIRSFSEGREYLKRREAWEKNKSLPEPRRDLRLEALGEILQGNIGIHCHCYRSDEILMLLRVADQFGVKIRSLQHVLEGYKVGPEINAHGASVSLFADWWAYKIEAFDAIPFAASLMQQAGVNVTLKSDSNELVRHLYQEAAKPIKYGSMPPEEALKLITINAAKQLGLEKRIGSIEVGKDADLAIFTGHPLNGFSRCEMTLIEGEVYFQRAKELKPVEVAKAAPLPPRKEAFAPIPTGKGTYIITGATIHLTDRVIKGGTVLVSGGKIQSVQEGPPLARENVQIVDAAGLHLYPGMIDAGTILGLTELGSARETQDFSDGGEFQPDLRASVAVNPESELIPVTRANGVLTVVTRPTGPLIAGQGALINLAGWTWKDMLIRDQVGLQLEFPPFVPFFSGDPTQPVFGRAVAKKQREEKIRQVKELFEQSLRYYATRNQAPDTPVNPRLEALIPYARGEKPIIIQAYRKSEIADALKLAKEMKWKIILSGAAEAWKLTDEIRKQDVAVIFGPVMTLPQEFNDPYDAPFTTPAKLHEAGIRFCIRSVGGSNSRNLPYEAAMAVSYGLPADVALKAVTLFPAKILGADAELGSIEAGKRANLVLTTGDILQPSTQVLALFIDGKPLEPSSRHTRLYEKYSERLKEFREGKTPLGTK